MLQPALKSLRGLFRYKSVIRWAAAIGLLAAVLLAVDANRAVGTLAEADGWLIGLALLLVQGQIVLSAWRWRFTAGRLGQKLPLAHAIAEYYLASLANLVLPGGVSGDAFRAARSSSSKEAPQPAGRSAAVRAVILERLAGQVALLALALGGFVWMSSRFAGEQLSGIAAVLIFPPLAFAVAALAVIILARYAPRKVRHWFAGFGPDMRQSWFRSGAWLVQGVSSLAVATLYIGAFAACSAAVAAPLAPAYALLIVPVTLLAMLLPVSIGGFGLREGAASALWPIAGYAAADGLAASLLYGIVCIVGALPGALVLLRPRAAQVSNRA